MQFPIVRLFGVPVPIGGVVAAEVMTPWGRVHHKGIVSDRYGSDGQPMILHASDRFGYVVETEAADFALRATGPVYFVGYAGEVPPDEVLRRARSRLGEKYRLLKNNCEHFVSGVHGLEPTSPQLRSSVGLTVTALATVAVIGGLIALAASAKT